MAQRLKPGEAGNKAGMKTSMQTGIGLDESALKHSTSVLNQLLSDEFTLYLKARKYHWNINGPMFNDLHSFFEMIYDELNLIVDEVAERIRQLGGMPAATMSEYIGMTRIPEEPGVFMGDRQMVESMMNGLDSTIKRIRENLHGQVEHEDEGSAHFLVDIMLKHEKKAWMLRSMLQGWKQA